MAVAKPPDPHELMLRADVDYFSQNVLSAKYAELKGLLYPEPRYRAFILSKRSGSHRVIHEPRRRLKDLQLKVLAFIEQRAGPANPCVPGFVPGRSIVTNARQHLAAQPYHLLNLDLEDFFPSITFFRVRGVFRKAPFNLGHEVATVLAQLCTYRNALPQGAPTSPAISNLVCRSLDRDLIALARRHRATYTRYADDLTFSFSVRDASRLPSNVCTFDSGLVTLGHEIQAIISDQHHFGINHRKTRMSTRHSRMEVTGVKINEFTNLKREFIDRVRGALNGWDKYGYANDQRVWREMVLAGCKTSYDERPWRRQTRLRGVPELRRVLWGKLLYIRMVRGAADALYTRLAEKFNGLIARERSGDPEFESPSLPVESIVRGPHDAELAVYVIEWAGDYQPAGASGVEMVGGQGTAFAFRNSTSLITCDHVLRWSGVIGNALVEVDMHDPNVRLTFARIVNPASGLELPVDVVARDQARDLALLTTNGAVLPRHFSALESPPNRNESVILIGYPNWSPGRVANHVSGVVLSRYPRSGLSRFEISTNIRQGNSGGPLVDLQYRLAGVAQQGATQQAGNDECLCVSEVNGWIKGLP